MEINYPGGMPKLPSFKYGRWIVPVIVILVALTGASPLFYPFEKDEIGAVTLFGKVVRKHNPCLHM